MEIFYAIARSLVGMRVLIATLLLSWLHAAWGGTVAEGLSSESEDEPARLQHRMFTIYTLEDACAESPMVDAIEVRPASMTLSAGDRIFLGASSTVVVIARDSSGTLIPGIPLAVEVLSSDHDMFYSQSALDYVEAAKEGAATLRARTLCPAHRDLSASIELTVVDSAPVTPGYCAYYIDEEMTLRGESWQLAEVDAAVMDGAAREGRNPRVAIGDFDSDGVPDTAFLIRRGEHREAAICLSTTPRRVQYLDSLYCDDAIDTTSAGSRYYDYERDHWAVYAADGISVSCFEKAGATYIHDAPGFERVIDSD